MNLTVILNLIKTTYSYVKKNYKLMIVIYAILATVLFLYLVNRNSTLSDENDRLSTNQEALLTDIDTYKTENGKNAARVTELELTSSEFEKLCSEQAERIKELGISIKRLESASTTVTSTTVNGNTSLRDSIIVYQRDTVMVADTIKYFKWSDPWNSIEGKIKGNDVVCNYSGIDTLTIAIHKVPKKFWFIKWGCKYVEVNLVNQNPSSQVIYNQTVKFK